MNASSRTPRRPSSKPSARSSPSTDASSMPFQAEWIESLSPWPEEFGLGRMRALLAELGNPQRTYPAIHVVGTNGKSTATRRAAAFLAREGVRAGAYTSPHVSGWSERIQVDGEDADFETAIERVREPAQRLGATQFEILTAAGLAEFATARVDAAVVEAGLGGRLDATNVLDAEVVVLTNVALELTDVLGDTHEKIAREKLAVVTPGASVVLGDEEWREAALEAGAGIARVSCRANAALALVAAETFLGEPVEPVSGVGLPGRLEHRSEEPLEIWDGAHNVAGVGWLLGRLPSRRYVVGASILEDKKVDGMLEALSVPGDDRKSTRLNSSHTVISYAVFC